MSAVTPPQRTVIESDEPLEDVDRHFRVFAGPGAGKTHWLALHIREVLRRSERLYPASRIACISYTNVAVAQILGRIGDAAHRVEGATIHSFLYRNVVRPNLHLLKDAAGAPLVRHELVDGHEEHRPSYARVSDWHTDIGKTFLAEPNEAYEYLRAVRWVRDASSGEWTLKPLSGRRPVQFLPTTQLHAYKPVYWRRGVIDHDDVLYFAYRLLEEHTALRGFLAARFPYLFIDEFQDTSPIQTQVVSWLADAGTTVGVIGDAMQSIYGFQGARPEDFLNFSLPGLADYEIVGNRRSTDTIVRLLNASRGDGLVQRGVRSDTGDSVLIYVDAPATAFEAVKRWVGAGASPVALAYRNVDVRQIRNPSAVASKELWAELTKADMDRALFLERAIRGGELAFQGLFSTGMREMLSAFRLRARRFRDPVKYDGAVSDLEQRGIAVSALEWLATHRDALRRGTLLDAYQGLNEHLQAAFPGVSLKKAVKGGFKDFALATTFGYLADSLRSQEEMRDVRTIHQAKGDEFTHVLVCLQDEKQLIGFLTTPEPTKEEHRLFYVAASRAKDGLFFCVPTLAQEARIQLRTMGILTVGGESEQPSEMVDGVFGRSD
jgi:DNA helicase-2/ATP-dependent DNA helicase PcrA